MSGTDVEKHDLGVDILEDIGIDAIHLQPGPDLVLQTIVLVADMTTADRIVLTQRMPFELPMVENPPQVGMAVEANAILIVGLAFSPVGGRPDSGGTGNSRLGIIHRNPNLGHHVVRQASQRIYDSKAIGMGDRVIEIVNDGDIEQNIELEVWIGPHRLKDTEHFFLGHIQYQVAEYFGASRPGKGGANFFECVSLHFNRVSP